MVQAATENEAPGVALLKSCGALLFGKFRLASGKESDYYFDSKKLTLDPEGARFVASQLLRKLEDAGIEVVGGTAYSAIPIASHICLYSNMAGKRPIRAFYVRKESKGHGTDELVEGKVSPNGTEVAIVEDVVTSGKSLIDAIDKAEDYGCKVTHTIVLVDRDEGGREAVEAKGYKFWALFTVRRTPGGEVDFQFNGYPIEE